MKNIAIVTTKLNEYTTEIVMDWLEFYGARVFRINSEDFDNVDFQLELDENGAFKCSCMTVDFSINYHSVWFRRWKQQEMNDRFVDKNHNNLSGKLLYQLGKTLQADYNTIHKTLLHSFNAKKQLSNSSQLSVNKLIVLKEAVNCELKVPKFILTSSKKKLFCFFNTIKTGIITKDISVPFNYISKNREGYSIYVNPLSNKVIKQLPNQFAVSFFQERIEKKYEIRTFILNKQFFSMAIFSQNDNQTKEDFRRYNYIMPNRTVPYKLPLQIEKKILKLMSKIGLSTGSVDLIKGICGEYYFLEINPVGQFGMVSSPCNYNLEQKVADYLFNE